MPPKRHYQSRRLHSVKYREMTFYWGKRLYTYDGVLISARPGRKPVTATKLGIYSTYSQRSSIHFLDRISNFCKTLKFRRLSVQSGLPGKNDLRVGRKMATFQVFFFSVQGTGGSPTGPDPENRVGYLETRSPGRPVSSGLQVPGEPGYCRARTRPPWWISRGLFSSKCPSIAPTEMSNTPRW